ncbi:MAG: Methyl-accepting chemotaxis protein [uncultured Sulfurovum sp.]|uniref:Methyl-accepting chemotaxis protein n=1 Tax=uncultured Sulfurovum sp. TaxID=269237 RepID=A0A6S6TB87_9BACT|nr:MAG: Methyl-accepting chemotaxis protein [uncultured Sulfurovum sp.]
MKKDEIIHKMRLARLAHVQWVQRAKSLVNGFPIKEEDIPLTPDACAFGKWFYSDGQVLLAIFNDKSVKELENLHNELHEEYMNIFKIYFDISNLNFFSKLLKQGKRVSTDEKQQAQKFLRSLEKISDTLIQKLNIMETKINMAEEGIFEKYT